MFRRLVALLMAVLMAVGSLTACAVLEENGEMNGEKTTLEFFKSLDYDDGLSVVVTVLYPAVAKSFAKSNADRKEPEIFL